ncbi:hypothetical protein PM3016_1435 [Paenibacillus mucilaginosus 3016]|uniref:HTH cro/C1-type domain-containing protein n=1 Tax=Paenibacillus mucilaginosus 3016 TaxID=1116391 RepID=H6NEQ6_9BACL|nr:helix-turn-helix transcriptional regulator [Paenibacillus mucilaginosus]AFC28360.1 hypothetical protein PM3016_1435 [Paenibacillus mucilaginosus 3016]WFA17161.1 XRE family transcriptional regulator [Paenibacillus mucilaginosus]
MLDLGNRIKYLREKRAWTQKEFAAKTKLTIVQLSRYETNDRKPDPEALKRIADILETSTDYLLGRTNDPAPLPEVKDPLDDPDMDLFFYGWEKLTPERQEEVKAYVRAQLLMQEAEEREKKSKKK